MTWESMIGLALAMTVLAVTPGPGVLAAIGRALSAGFWPALFFSAGIILGDLVFLLAAIFGLATVASLLGDFFLLVRLAGAAYLVWLGIRLWRSQPQALHGCGQDRAAGRADLLAGLAVTLGNPKVIVFYLGFLPNFLSLQAMTAADVLLACGIVSGVLAIVLGGYVLAAERARRLFSQPDAVRRLNRGAGTVMIGTGAVIATR